MISENNVIKKRTAIVLYFFSFLFMLFIARISWIILKNKGATHPIAYSTFLQKKSILDRNGHVLASSLPAFSIYANPNIIKHKEFVSEKLSLILKDRNQDDLLKKISSSKSFVWIARHISPEKKREIEFLGIEGISFQNSAKRIYPYKNLFSHIVGITDIDQNAFFGLEKALEKDLLEKNIKTSMDIRIQNIVYQALLKQMLFFQASAANAILCNAKTGQVLAMISLPDFSPHDKKTNNPDRFFNRNVSGVYEFGSIMKIYNAALFLESGKGTLQTIFDATHPIAIGKFKIKDYYGKKRPLSVYEGFIHSSNIVNAKMAWMSGEKNQRAFFEKMGFFSPVDTILKEKACPIIDSKKWSTDRVMTASYGYGFAVTPLHVIKSFISLVTGKECDISFLSEKKEEDKKKRILSEENVLSIRKLLKDATEKGCARKAFTPLCPVGAKTGTANLRKGKSYVQGENLASCIAAFPINDPKYVLLVSIERPQKKRETLGRTTGGWIAAPVVKNIVEKMMPIMHQKTFGQISR